MTTYKKFQKDNFDLSLLGFEMGGVKSNYLCTPLGASVLGWAGVDGIHFCQIRTLGETVFAVSPMNTPGDNVHPVARSWNDFLRMLISCGSTAAMEQMHAWSREQYRDYLMQNPVTEAAAAVLEQLRMQYDLSPISDPHTYIRGLEAEFDTARLKFKKEYHDVLTLSDTERSKTPSKGSARRRRVRPATEVCLTPEEALPSTFFRTERVGQQVIFTHPFTGVQHTLTVMALEAPEINLPHRRTAKEELPTRCLKMTYTITPELPRASFLLFDTTPSDAPRRTSCEKDGGRDFESASIAIIAGADGPTMIFDEGMKRAEPSVHVAYSSLHFEEVDAVDWQMDFQA